MLDKNSKLAKKCKNHVKSNINLNFPANTLYSRLVFLSIKDVIPKIQLAFCLHICVGKFISFFDFTWCKRKIWKLFSNWTVHAIILGILIKTQNYWKKIFNITTVANMNLKFYFMTAHSKNCKLRMKKIPPPIHFWLLCAVNLLMLFSFFLTIECNTAGFHNTKLLLHRKL